MEQEPAIKIKLAKIFEIQCVVCSRLFKSLNEKQLKSNFELHFNSHNKKEEVVEDVRE